MNLSEREENEMDSDKKKYKQVAHGFNCSTEKDLQNENVVNSTYITNSENDKERENRNDFVDKSEEGSEEGSEGESEKESEGENKKVNAYQILNLKKIRSQKNVALFLVNFLSVPIKIFKNLYATKIPIKLQDIKQYYKKYYI